MKYDYVAGDVVVCVDDRPFVGGTGSGLRLRHLYTVRLIKETGKFFGVLACPNACGGSLMVRLVEQDPLLMFCPHRFKKVYTPDVGVEHERKEPLPHLVMPPLAPLTIKEFWALGPPKHRPER